MTKTETKPLTQSKIDVLLRSTGSSAVGQVLAYRGHRARNGAYAPGLTVLGYVYLTGLRAGRTGRIETGLDLARRQTETHNARTRGRKISLGQAERTFRAAVAEQQNAN